MSRGNKIALVIMIAIGAGIFIFEARNLNLSHLIGDLLNLNPFWLGIAFLCMVINWGFEALVIKVFLKGRVEHFSFKSALRVPLIEHLFNSITPFASGGQPAQLVTLMQSGVEAGRASSLLLMKFVVYQSMVIINFILSMLIGFKSIQQHFAALSYLIIFGFVIHFVVIIALLMIMYWYNFTYKMVHFVLKPFKWFMKPEKLTKLTNTLDEKMNTFYAESVHMKKEKKKILKAMGLTFIQLLFYYSVPYFVILALGYTHVNLVAIIVMHVMIVMIVSLFPIPGGSGGAEISFKALFAMFIPSASKLILGMLLWRFITYYFGIIMGLIAMSIKPEKAIEIKREDD